MYVRRIGLYDFKVIFSPEEGKDIIAAAKEAEHTPEEIVAQIIVLALEAFYEL
ncbi:unnamed protein product [marine sediment metagenome]|uniref:Uncharacterized protein n=1 Tax=marine sediment metagenome TaxID=412755 RepID=X1R2K4_9ZZZZ